MIDENENDDLKSNSQEVKAAVTCEQIAPLDVNEQTFCNHSGSISLPLKSWEPTLEKAIKAIVSIKANCVRSFDTEISGGSCATGFIVDEVRGIILSNRHVVSPAPIVAQAIFKNYEEVELQPIYRDPVHDFGFFKFDPSKIKFMDLVRIPLCPEKAKVGIEIKVAGNDNNETLSILSGTLARLDRRAPNYGIGKYNDFNTFYLQAASGTSGGSSGSPVIDIEGDAVALNAGGATKKASSSFYLPLNRVKRALKYIQEGKQVPRGTLQTEFEYKSYNELRHLGLKSSTEQEFRDKFPDETGLLVVRIVLPKGPADDLLVPGDIVICANKNMIANFDHLFSIIDDSVGKDIELTICRGKTQMDVKLKIQDLHSITPNRFVEVGGSIINELSYQLAYSYSWSVKGPYIAESGYMFGNASAWRMSVIISINNIPTPDLDTFIEVMKTLPDGARVPLKFYHLYDVNKEKLTIMHVDRHWHKFKIAVRDDTTGLWNYESMPPPPSIHLYKPAAAQVQTLEESLHPGGKIWPSFVIVNFRLPYYVNGLRTTQFSGAGIIVSTDPPLIICDRYAIPTRIGDIYITFANSIIIPGKLTYLHPIYNYAVLTYDQELLGTTPVKAIELSEKDLVQGDSVYLVGIYDYTPVVKKTTVKRVANVSITKCIPPRWRAMNVEEIKLDDHVESFGGVLCDGDGKVQALWLNYYLQNEKYHNILNKKGVPKSLVEPTLKSLKNGELPKLYSLDVEFGTIQIVKAKDHGLSDEWVKRFESIPNSKYELLRILHILDSTSRSGKLLEVGDIILMINGNLVSRMSDLSVAFHYSEEVDVLILRDGKEKEIKVTTTPYCDKEVTHIIGWSGAIIQETYKAALEHIKNVPTGVYVSRILRGSPALTIGEGVWIVEIQGRKVSDLDSFLKAIYAHEKEIKECPEEDNDGYIRIKTISQTNVTEVVTIKLDPHYWSTWQLVEDKEGWKFIED
ncbi:trypsin-like cysteine/serine peptidase domain-containing protein [Glomus cerebriforme]|uniref:Trypsin-like cysteine/serine peptidase domain-containing protein n=1 Tax=Glomus cerebriforme TaxID=658196 RepID=A0A397TNA0_9GLOM|nr:trypsin-like cysteine/serine peptidase domain-containing protein [Glomus cerebriforme]